MRAVMWVFGSAVLKAVKMAVLKVALWGDLSVVWMVGYLAVEKVETRAELKAVY